MNAKGPLASGAVSIVDDVSATSVTAKSWNRREEIVLYAGELSLTSDCLQVWMSPLPQLMMMSSMMHVTTQRYLRTSVGGLIRVQQQFQHKSRGWLMVCRDFSRLTMSPFNDSQCIVRGCTKQQ